MIVTCVCGDKKFEVDATLIPKEGRLVQCGFCDRKWHLKNNALEHEIVQKVEISRDVNLIEDNSINAIKEDNSINVTENDKDEFLHTEDTKINKVESNIENSNKNKKQSFKEKSKPQKIEISFINLFLVFIITIVALIVLLDTFKISLAKYYPNLINVLDSLYQAIQDIKLFIKDLF